jgi:hypothetical protein
MVQSESEYGVERNVFGAAVLVVMINDKPGEIDAERLAAAPMIVAEHTKWHCQLVTSDQPVARSVSVH